MANKKEQLNFQDNLKRLDDIVESISSKTLSLDESLSLYEEGMKIIKELEQELKEAEAKVEKVVEIK